MDFGQIALHGRTELIESALHPGLDDAHEQFMDTFDEMEGQLDKEMKRIKDLRSKVDQDPGESAEICRLPSKDIH